jgi:hypothetical protein
MQMTALTRMIIGKKPEVAYTHYTGRYIFFPSFAMKMQK